MKSSSNFSDLIDKSNNNSIFKNEEVFNSNYIPVLLHREHEMQALVTYFRSIWTNPTASSRKVVIYGPVGTGKTAVSQSFCTELSKFLQRDPSPGKPIFRYFHLNCRKTKTPSLILTTILRQLVPGFPLRGFSVEELLRMLTLLIVEQNLVTLLVLDEIDYLIPSERTDFLYALSRLEESSPTSMRDYGYTGTTEARFNLLAITRDPNFRFYLDSSTASSLGKNIITFNKYSRAALFDIIASRAEQGLHEESYSDEVLDIITSLTEEYGDARFAIDLLWRAAKLCDQKQDYKNKITTEHVRKAIISVLPVERSVIDDLHTHQKLVLLSIARLLQNDKSSATTPEVRNYYRMVCEEAGIQPRRQTQLWTYIKDLGRLGLLKLSVENRHKKGRSMGRVTNIQIRDLPLEEIITSLNHLIENSITTS